MARRLPKAPLRSIEVCLLVFMTVGFLRRVYVFARKAFHVIHMAFIHFYYPPDEPHKKGKEDDEGNNRPYGDLFDSFQYVLIHDALF